MVEGFYSVVKNHKQRGHQSNDNHVERAIVDWILPHPIAAPNTMRAISKLYTEGDIEHNLKSHRAVRFFDRRNRSGGNYETGKIIDR